MKFSILDKKNQHFFQFRSLKFIGFGKISWVVQEQKKLYSQ